jgi:hypothetical protein
VKRFFSALRNRRQSINDRIARKRNEFSGFLDYTNINEVAAPQKYAFVFVCQAGRLEIGALLLAASLKRYLKCDYELIAAIPTPENIMGSPNPLSIKLLEEMGVRIVNIHNKIVSNNRRQSWHLITNKMYCLKIPTGADKLIFLDSDFLCCNDFKGDSRFSIPFNARLAIGSGARGYEGKWYKFYETVNTSMPLNRIRVEDGDHFRYVPPSFNSGFIAVNTDRATDLANCWFECWEAFDRKGVVRSRPYHIGQYSLSVAVVKMGMPFEIIERSWIFKYFMVCHKMSEMKENSEVMRLVISLLREYPGIIEVIKDNPEYNFLNALTMNTNTSTITVNSFEIKVEQQNAYFDNMGRGPAWNQSPIAADDSAATIQDTPVTINVIANDSDPDGTIDPATVTITVAAGYGTTIANTNGTVTYKPAPGFTGTDTFTYVVKDNGGATSNEANVTIKVDPTETSYFDDDFSTNTVGDYTVNTEGGVASFTYDASGKRAKMLAGDDIELQFSHSIPALNADGSFSIDFLPIKKNPNGGLLHIRLVENANTYYDIHNTHGYGVKSTRKIVHGQVVDSASFQN